MLIANNIGIFGGLFVVRLFQGKEHNFLGSFEKSAAKEKNVAKSLSSSFLPEQLVSYTWGLLESPRRWFGFWFLVVMVRNTSLLL